MVWYELNIVNESINDRGRYYIIELLGQLKTFWENADCENTLWKYNLETFSLETKILYIYIFEKQEVQGYQT